MATNTRDLYPTITKRKNEESTTEKTETPSTTSKTETSSASKLPEYTDFEYEKFNYGDIDQSDTVKQAWDMLQQQLANKPGAYQSQWQTQLNDVINKIMNREKFSYDVNGDALYQQYKDQYVTQGQMAMQDAMGQAAAMTGGYGNSYAQSVGQQTYQGYLQQLTDKVPELYQLALSKYNQEGQDLLNQYALLGDQENLDYGRYRDTVSDHYTDLDYLTGRYDTEWNKEAANREFEAGQHSEEQSYKYQNHINSINNQWQQKEFEQALNQVSGNSGSGGSGAGYDNGSVSTSDIMKMQAELGIEADGKWGPKSVEVSGGLTAGQAYTAWKNGTLGEGAVKMVVTDATESFKKNVYKKSELTQRGNQARVGGVMRSFDSYEDYIDAVIEKQYNDGLLNADEVASLIAYYGIGK